MQRTAVSATKNAFDHRTVLSGKEVGHFYPSIDHRFIAQRHLRSQKGCSQRIGYNHLRYCWRIAQECRAKRWPMRRGAINRARGVGWGQRRRVRQQYLNVVLPRTFSHRFYILKRRQSKKPTVFSAKLRWTFIANFQSSRRCIHRTTQHEASCFLKAELLLIL